MLEEHCVALTDEVADPGLKAGDVGTIVHVHRDDEAFEVEFLTLDGHTAALVTHGHRELHITPTSRRGGLRSPTRFIHSEVGGFRS